MSEVINEYKEQLSKIVSENIGQFAKLTTKTQQTLNFVRLHASHLKGIEIGWIIKVEMYTDQESVEIKNTIFKAKLKMAKKSGRKHRL